jgi:ligand-binding sensor domain-containing protein/GGDEF domain-containing protein
MASQWQVECPERAIGRQRRTTCESKDKSRRNHVDSYRPQSTNDANICSTLRGKRGALRLIGVFSLCTLAATEVLALDTKRSINQFTQRRWSMAEGLPQVSATAIVQDNDGYLWIGTFGGLVRFDGARFEHVDGDGSCNARIVALAVGHDGSILVGTQRSGLCRVVAGKLTRADLPGGLEIGGVPDIEAASNGIVRLATARGLVTIDGSRVTRVTVANGLPDESVRAIATHRDGSVWVGTRRGLCIAREAVCDGPGWSAAFKDIAVEAIHHSASGASWIGTARGLYQVKDGRAASVLAEAGAAVQAITEDHDGGLWVGLSPGGLRRILPRIESLTGLDPNTGDSIADILEDREGNLWIGTAGAGLVKLGEGAAIGFSLQQGQSFILAMPIVAEGGGRAWVGTRCGGLARIEPAGVTFHGAREGLGNVCIESLQRDTRGTLWIGTFRAGLHRMDDGSIRKAGDPPSPDRSVRAIVEGKDGHLLIGTDNGLFRFDRDAHRFELVEGTASLDIHALDIDEGGAIWIGTLTGVRILRAGQVEVVTRQQGLSNDAVRAIHRDAAGVAWIGTYGGGLNRMEGQRIFAYGPEHGLPDRFVSKIIEDRWGRLWLSGNRGVTRMARSELDAVAKGLQPSVVANVFDATDGMPATETVGGGQPAGALDADGKIWIPTVGGLAIFDTSSESSNAVAPLVRIEKVLVDGVEIDRASGPVVLQSGARNLEIHYTGLSFRAPEKVRFRYRISGFDDRWFEAGTRRVAYYPVIPSGDLDFRVIAANEDGVWNEQGAGFTFRTTPRFVETWSFWGLSAAALSAAWGTVLLIRTRTAAARERTLQREVAKRTAELAKLHEDLQAANRELADLASTDGLTGLANRRTFDAHLEREWRRAMRSGTEIGLLMIDVDRFKAFNDRYGHALGDEALRTVSRVLGETIQRAGDLVARYGGEEFAVILVSSNACRCRSGWHAARGHRARRGHHQRRAGVRVARDRQLTGHPPEERRRPAL